MSNYQGGIWANNGEIINLTSYADQKLSLVSWCELFRVDQSILSVSPVQIIAMIFMKKSMWIKLKFGIKV